MSERGRTGTRRTDTHSVGGGVLFPQPITMDARINFKLGAGGGRETNITVAVAHQAAFSVNATKKVLPTSNKKRGRELRNCASPARQARTWPLALIKGAIIRLLHCRGNNKMSPLLYSLLRLSRNCHRSLSLSFSHEVQQRC